MNELPRAYTRLRSTYPELAGAYDRFGAACAEAGPLDERSRSLIKLGISIGARLEGAVHAHTRKALAAGAQPEELRHAALLAMTTIGFPSAVAVLGWVEETLLESGKLAKKNPTP